MTTELRDHLQTTLGTAYVIERELGGGGMSRVFVADEAALGRKVVVKVLSRELAEGLSAERFRREVRLAARLQHPHIVPLLAAGELDGGVLYYTMPLVEGESLRARLAREGGLPVADAVRVLRDVAGALAYAHHAGVVHRDVKPDNVLLSHGGAVVADFGIAKAISVARAADGDGDALRSSTLTAAGTSLGTPAYMAPEQAAGDVADHRADLYALGVLAYEMLAGRAPFDGRTAQQLLAAHAVEAPEPITRRRPNAPPALGSLIMRLLEKNPADRPQTADEVLRALEEIGDSARRAPAWQMKRGLPRAARWPLVAVAAGVVGAVLGVWIARRPDGPSVRPVVATLGAPEGQELRPEGGFTLSLDGTRLALVAADARGATAIWVRALDSLAAKRVEGTEGGSGPFWSPDGTSLGFFAGGQLRVADLRGGQRRTLCPAPRPGGGAWTRGGVIAYAPDFLSAPLFQVPAAGGRCTALTRLRPNDYERHRSPSALPDGQHVLFNPGRTTANAAVSAVDLATRGVTDVRQSSADAQWAPPDWLLFRDRPGGSLFAQRFDLRTLRPTGEARTVLDRMSSLRSFSSFTVGARALVAVRLSGGERSLVWVDRQSAVTDSVLAPAGTEAFYGAATAGLSRDGRRIAFGGLGLWIHDRDRNVATRVRAETLDGQGILDPAWGPGDSLIAYSTIFRGPVGLRVYHVAAGGSDSLFALGRRNVRTPDWSPDGRRIAFQLSAGDAVATDEVWVYSLAGRRAARAWEAPGNVSTPRWSPDGQWMAYVSDESGAPEVYVRPASGAGVAARVSTAGGELPRWRGDGRELYYRAPGGAIMAVGVRLGATAALSPPRVAAAGPPFSRTIRAFEVSSDGERFVAFARGDPPVFTLVVDWPALIARP